MSQASHLLNFTSLCPASRPKPSDPVTYKGQESQQPGAGIPSRLFQPEILNATSQFLRSTTPSLVCRKVDSAQIIYSSKWAGRRNTGLHGGEAALEKPREGLMVQHKPQWHPASGAGPVLACGQLALME